jgi:acetolactate synthase-1/2/3 large subunit
MIKRKQHNMWLPDFGLDLKNPDIVALAESFGAKGYRVASRDQFDETFAQAQQEKWLKIIEIMTTYPQKIQ